jgi:hypothetical protein
MAPRHPFVWLPPAKQKQAFIGFLVLTLVVMVGLRILDAPLHTELSPSGIVSFELAGELPLARSMMEAWGAKGQVYAGLSLGLDYLFLVAYAGCIGLGCGLVAGSLVRRVAVLSSAGVFLAWAQFGAALLDAVENYALIRVLLGSGAELWPPLARWCAVLKFLIVAAGLATIGIGGVVVLVGRVRRRVESEAG